MGLFDGVVIQDAVKEQFIERFTEEKDKKYVANKIKNVDECKDVHELLYLCSEIDSQGLDIIANKIEFEGGGYRLFEFIKDYKRIAYMWAN